METMAFRNPNMLRQKPWLIKTTNLAFTATCYLPLYTSHVGVSIMWPAEIEVMVSQPCLMCGSTQNFQTLCLGARPRYNLVVDEDVKKPNKQTNTSHVGHLNPVTCKKARSLLGYGSIRPTSGVTPIFTPIYATRGSFGPGNEQRSRASLLGIRVHKTDDGIWLTKKLRLQIKIMKNQILFHDL